MNHGEAWGSGDRGGSRGRSPASGDRKAKNPVDRSVNDSSGNRGRGFRGRGRSIKQVYVQKSSQVSSSGSEEKVVQQDQKTQEGGVGSSTKQPEKGVGLKVSGDNKDLLQSSAASCSSKNISLSGDSSVSKECEEKDVDEGDSDVVNRLKDVSLSSTSDHKIELSSVEVHDSAGDAGNLSNENTARQPFDLFLKSQGYQLKPNILELNRQKRKANKGHTGIFVRPGMVLLKNYLSLNDQAMIVNKCRQLGLGEGGFYQPGYRDEAILQLKMMCLGKNWDPETSRYGETRPVDGSIPPKIPVEFNQLVEKAMKESKKMKGDDGIPYMSPDICIVNFYSSTGRLGLHQDKDESRNSIQKGLPVVSFSIGDSAEFLYGDERDEEKAAKVMLESGDVLIFGGESRNVFHGVRSIQKGTAPKVLVQETNLRPGRLNLTFRQY